MIAHIVSSLPLPLQWALALLIFGGGLLVFVVRRSALRINRTLHDSCNGVRHINRRSRATEDTGALGSDRCAVRYFTTSDGVARHLGDGTMDRLG